MVPCLQCGRVVGSGSPHRLPLHRLRLPRLRLQTLPELEPTGLATALAKQSGDTLRAVALTSIKQPTSQPAFAVPTTLAKKGRLFSFPELC